ncbi:hypothetical protein Ade02nite_19990 [Paractinoplanes deccanensis]|uniref:Uncharacterized protein n=1 Tax=Paractinoplanes deccanensis TaxID=113561 RepID=A0ABQ3Y033_9ACTN|nr:hypothetical protein [Actinoplanes deccanensis]GID73358.1 hypothetical protein Ade02nite_19990 [Actinoplanes deccanensis]
MNVKVYDVDQPDREIDGKYTIDTTFGLPAVGDELYLRERDYNTNRFYLEATVRRRRFVFSDNKPEGAEVHVWVQRARR